MNPTAIFSKSGKGVQEASGKTSQLSRPDRAVLSAIDGRATLADVAGKVGKQFDNEFKALVNKLDKDGFIREVSPGAAGSAGGGAKPSAAPAKPASKPTAPMDIVSDLDFTSAMTATPKKSAPSGPPPQALSRAPAPPPKPTVAVPPKPPPPSAAEQAKQAQIAKDQQSAFARAREEAEQKAQEQRDRLKAEAEAKVRAETEAKLREEAEVKAKADAEAKAKKAEADAATARSAAIRAAAEAKVKAEAEAKRAKEEAERARREAEENAERARQEAERARKEAEEKAERARREAEEKARREQEELKRKLEEERKAREEAERKAKEEAERARREIEEERRKLEAERKRLEEEQRREEEERAARRKRDEEEEQERRKQRAAEEERERAEKEEARKVEESEQSFDKLMAAQTEWPGATPPAAAPPPAPSPAAAPPSPAAPPPAPQAKAATGDAFADSLLADLDSFTQRDDDERKAKEDSERKAKDEIARKQQEEVERQEREAAEVRQRIEDERRRKDEEARRAREEEERRARKQREEQEQAEREAEERRRKMAATTGAAPAGGDDLGITDEDLELDEVKSEAALLDKKKNRKEEREQEREKERAQKKERDREAKSKKEKEREEKEKKAATAYRPRRKSNLGRNVALSLFVLLIIGAGVVHVMPVSTVEFEKAATEALGRPVRIASGRFSAINGVQFKFEGVSIGDLSIPVVRAYPEIGSVFGDRKVFTRVELEGLSLPQDAIGDVLFTKAKGDALTVSQVSLRNLKLSGALALPPLDGEVQLVDGGVRTATLRGPEGLLAKLGVKDEVVEFDVGTAQFTLPFAPGITLVQFAMKGDATRQGMKIKQWDGLLFSGQVTGTATVRWGNTWTVDGVMTARGVNAAVFAPALVSNGRAEGTGRFSLSGVEPAKLGSTGRLEGSFTVLKGVLGSVDLSRALQTGGRQITGQTQFAEMSGQGVYDRGAVSLRNINIGAGALNAGVSADVSENGALSGRIIADVKTAAQNVRITLILGGTVQEPQVRN
jgi:hypothetical protein